MARLGSKKRTANLIEIYLFSPGHLPSFGRGFRKTEAMVGGGTISESSLRSAARSHCRAHFLWSDAG